MKTIQTSRTFIKTESLSPVNPSGTYPAITKHANVAHWTIKLWITWHLALTCNTKNMRGSRKFCQRGSNSDNVERGSKYRWKRTVIGLPARSNLNGVSLSGRWWLNIECRLGSLFRFLMGSGQVLLRYPITLWFFKGRLRNTCPPLWFRV